MDRYKFSRFQKYFNLYFWILIFFLILYSLEFDLHGLIVEQLADILSIDPDTTKEEISRLIKRCPELPNDGDNISKEEKHNVILMVRS